MTNQQIINAINGIAAIINRNDILPYTVRRAIRKNYNTLMEEYSIYDEQRGLITNNDCFNEEKLTELLNQNVDVNIAYINECEFENCPFTIKDEMALEFMIKESEDKNNG